MNSNRVLKEDDINFIIANTDLERAKVLEWYNEFLETCPSGKINKSQFIQFYKKLIPNDAYEEDRFCEYVFDVYDTDKNGYVDFAEFLIAFMIRSKGSLRDKLEWLFDVYDTDNNNYITYWELGHVLRLVFAVKNIKQDAYEKAKEIMRKIDRSHDERLSKAEFIAGGTQDEQLRKLLAPF